MDQIDLHSNILPEHLPDAVRDLAWLLDPEWDMMREMVLDTEAYRSYRPPNSLKLQSWLQNLATHPQALEQAIANAGHRRLGLYFETLIAFYFANCPEIDWHILSQNKQIIEGPRTVGELDFLLDTPDGTVHLEAAVKFYLGHQQENGQDDTVRWIGPNGRDRLDLKIHRMASHQLPLGKSYANTSLFWLKGMLFQPWQKPLPLPTGVLPKVANHCWARASDFLQHRALHQKDWCSLPKLRWLTATNALTPIDDIENLVGTINRSSRPQMLHAQNTGERLMVVHDTWPEPSDEKPEI